MAARQTAAAKWSQRRAAQRHGKDQDGDAESPSRAAAFPLDPADLAAAMYMSPYMMNPAVWPAMFPPFGGYSPAHALSPWNHWADAGGMPPGMYPGFGFDSPPAMSRNKSGNSSLARSKSHLSEAETPSGKSKSSKKKKKAKQEEAGPAEAPWMPEDSVEGFCIEEVMPNLLDTAQETKGGRHAGLMFLQSRLSRADVAAEEKADIVAKLQSSVLELSFLASGSAVVQEMLELASAQQKQDMLAALCPEALRLSLDAHGCRVMQKMLEIAPREPLAQIARQLEPNVDGCIENMHGNHVIQKCVERMPPDCLPFIVKAVEQKTCFMASHSYGCRVLQRLLEHCTPSTLSKILDDIVENAAKLAQDSYGNYVIQHTLQHGRVEDKKRIIQVIQGDLVRLAKSKCSSNVVDKCFEVATSGEHSQVLEAERTALMQAALGDEGAAEPPLVSMVDDRWGHFIAQRVIKSGRASERQQLLRQLESAELGVKGKRILTSLKGCQEVRSS